MDNPFSADKNNPFQTPYQQPDAPAAAQSIKPFTAVDLGPPAGQNGNRHSAPPPTSGNPFAGGDFDSAFMSREAPMQPMQPLAPFPAAAPALEQTTPKPAAQPTAPTPVAQPMAYSAPVAQPTAFPQGPKGPLPASGHGPGIIQAPAASPSLPTGNASAPKQGAAPKPDFTPVPMSSPASIHQSDDLSMSVFNDEVNGRKPAFFLSTTQTVDGFRIQTYLGLVSVEVVIPKDVLFRNSAPYGDLHRIKAAEDQLQRVKAKALEELGEKAKSNGADGVVGVTIQFSQFDAIVCLCSAVGTAVKLAD